MTPAAVERQPRAVPRGPVRMSDDEWAAVDRLADELGVSRAKLLRACVALAAEADRDELRARLDAIPDGRRRG